MKNKNKKIKNLNVHKDFSKNKEFLDKIFGGDILFSMNFGIPNDLEYNECNRIKPVIKNAD